MLTTSERWTNAENALAMQGQGLDALFVSLPDIRIRPEDYREDSPERALAIRMDSLTGEDYREAEHALRQILRIQASIDDMLDRHGYPSDPEQLELMTDDWRDGEDYARWDEGEEAA